MVTFAYKHGYIHDNFTSGVVRVQIGYNVVLVKSVNSAKRYITKAYKAKLRAALPI